MNFEFEANKPQVTSLEILFEKSSTKSRYKPLSSRTIHSLPCSRHGCEIKPVRTSTK